MRSAGRRLPLHLDLAVKRPTRDDCLALLAAQADPADPPHRWRILGIPYAEDDALRLAELCLLTHQDLSPLASTAFMLDLARRLADLEEKADRRRTARRIRPESGVAQPSDGGGWI
jgi:hypothetical protein